MGVHQFFLLGIVFWIVSAAGGMALLSRLTRGSRHRRRWLILGGMILLPPAWNIGHPTIFMPAWVGVVMGLVYNPGKVFRLENVATFVLYFGSGAVVTAIGLYLIDKFRKGAGPGDSEEVASREDLRKPDGDVV
jgi:hypothetical protein